MASRYLAIVTLLLGVSTVFGQGDGGGRSIGGDIDDSRTGTAVITESSAPKDQRNQPMPGTVTGSAAVAASGGLEGNAAAPGPRQGAGAGLPTSSVANRSGRMARAGATGQGAAASQGFAGRNPQSLPASPAEANKFVEELLRSGDKDGAVAAAREARKEWPDDKNLLAFDKIVGYKSPNIFGKARELARELLEGITMHAGSMPVGQAAERMRSQSGGDGPIMAGAISLPGATLAWPSRTAETREAMSAMAIGDYQKLDEKMSSLLADDPNDYRSYRGRAYARWKLGRNAEAVEDARHAVALEPHDPLSRAALVDALVDLDRPKEAVIEADRGFEAMQGLPPNLEAAHLFHARSRAWAQLNQEDREFDDLRRAAELQPNVYGTMAQDAQRRRFWNSLFGRLKMPDDPLAQLAVGAAGAAALLFPSYFAIGWWRRRRETAARGASDPGRVIYPRDR